MLRSAYSGMQASFRLLESRQRTVPGADLSHLLNVDTSWYVHTGVALKIMSLMLLAFSVFTDLICSLLPFSILWNLQLSCRKKVVVGVLMVLGVM
jgi:hypothetical protein